MTLTVGIGVAHLPRRCQPRLVSPVRAAGPLMAVCAAARGHRTAACSNPASSVTGVGTGRAPCPRRGRRQDDPRRLGRWWRRADTEFKLPKGDVVLGRDRAAGRPGRGPRRWHDGHERSRTARQVARVAERRPAKDPSGDTPARRPAYFAAWEPDGGRYAMLRGRPPRGRGHQSRADRPRPRERLRDPEDLTSRSLPHRLSGSTTSGWSVVPTGDAGSPLATIIDVETGDQTEGPSGDRLLATSADGKRSLATMADQGSPIVIRDMAGWLAGARADRSPPSNHQAVRRPLGQAFRESDTPSQRLSSAWPPTTLAQSPSPSTTAASSWRRVARPDIGPARGAVVAWLR